MTLFTGARKREINARALNDLDGNIININKSVRQKDSSDDEITPPKNRSSVRSIQTPPRVAETLLAHKAKQSIGSAFTNDFYICGGIRTIRDTTLERKKKEFASAGEVKEIRIHDFRHSHASLLANNGINIQETSRRLGHSDITITLNTYSHLYPKEEDRATVLFEKLGEF